MAPPNRAQQNKNAAAKRKKVAAKKKAAPATSTKAESATSTTVEPEKTEESQNAQTSKSKKITATKKSKTVVTSNDGGARKALETAFPNGFARINVSGVNLLCGLRAIIKSLSAQYPDLTVPDIHEFYNLTQNEEYVARNAEIQLQNANNFYVDQLAILLKIAGKAMTPPKLIQLGVVTNTINGLVPQLTSWPDNEKAPDHQLWIFLEDFGAVNTGTAIEDFGHYQALAGYVAESAEAAEIPEDVKKDLEDMNKQMKESEASTNEQLMTEMYKVPKP